MAKADEFHHVVSQMQLKHFKAADGTLWHFDKRRSDKVVPRNTKRIFGVPGGNTLVLPGGRKHNGAERFLDREIENKAAPLLRRINDEVARGTAPTFTSEERRCLARLTYTQHKRNPATFFEKAGGRLNDPAFMAQLKQKLATRGHESDFEARVARMSPEALERVETRSRLEVTASDDAKMLDDLCARGVSYFTPGPNDSFLIGAEPLLRLSWPSGAITYQLSVGSRAMLVFGPPETEGKILELSPAQVAEFNEMIWEESDEVAACTRSLVESFALPYLVAKGSQMTSLNPGRAARPLN